MKPLSKISKNLNFVEKSYEAAKYKLYNTFGSEEEYEKFRQELVLATFTGNLDQLNQIIATYGYKDIHEFAVHLGGDHAYSNKSEKQVYNIVKESNLRARIMGILSNYTSPDYPGIISISSFASLAPLVTSLNLIPNVLYLVKDIPKGNLVMAMQSLFTIMSPGIASLISATSIHSVIHETLHYLSHDTKHMGLMNWEIKVQDGATI